MWPCLQMLNEREIGIRRNIKAKASFHLRVDIGGVRSYVCMYVCMCVSASGRPGVLSCVRAVRACLYVCLNVFFHSHDR